MPSETDDAGEQLKTMYGEQIERSPKKAPKEILREELVEAKEALQRSKGRLFYSGFSAGLDIGFSLLLTATVYTAAEGQLAPPLLELLTATTYSVGFIFVVLGRAELFTEQTTLAVLPVLSGEASVRELLRLWVIVYVANQLGAAAFAGFVVLIGPALGIIEKNVFGELARMMTDHSIGVILASGILAGWLMGLLSWLVAAGRDTISQIVVVWLVTMTIGLSHLHHSVAGSVEVMAGYFAGEGISLSAVLKFMLGATLGNAIGGPVFVALLKYSYSRKSRHAPS